MSSKGYLLCVSLFINRLLYPKQRFCACLSFSKYISSRTDTLHLTGRQVYFGSGIGRHSDRYLYITADTLPTAFYNAVRRPVACRHTFESFDGIVRFENDMPKSRNRLIGTYSRKIFVTPRQQVSEQHHMVGTVHRRISSVTVP